jgi:uroporphyrin-III C-methyltransferase
MTETPNKDDKATNEPLVLTDQVNDGNVAKTGASEKPAEPSPPSAKPAAAEAKKTKAWLAGSLAVVALLVAVAGSYIGHQQLLQLQQTLAQQQRQVSDVAAQIVQSQTQMQALGKQLQSVGRANDGVVSQLNSLTDIVANNQRRIDDVAGTERSDWQLAEAEYLLRLANQRLLMSGEVRGSKALLQAADNVLLALDDVALIPARQAIAADIAALNRADSLDLEGLYLRVAALSNTIEYLSLRSAKRWQAQPSEAVAAESTGSLWQTGVNKALATLSDLVVIRQSEQRVLPQLSDVEVIQLQQGLHYLVEQAKYAVVTGKQPLFDAAVANLQRWILDYYDLEEHNTAAMMSELQLLSDARVSQIWPDISGSLNALKMVMKDRLGLPSRDSAQATVQESVQ